MHAATEVKQRPISSPSSTTLLSSELSRMLSIEGPVFFNFTPGIEECCH